jgi:hypothetical protein
MGHEVVKLSTEPTSGARCVYVGILRFCRHISLDMSVVTAYPKNMSA